MTDRGRDGEREREKDGERESVIRLECVMSGGTEGGIMCALIESGVCGGA